MNKGLLPTVGIMLGVAIVALYAGNKLLSIFNLSMKDLDFKYTAQNKVQNWIKFMTPLAKDVGAKYGLPWQALVVQTAIETGWGKASLFQKYNNYGGIKAVAGQSSVTLPTVEYINGVNTNVNSKFATFPSKHAGLIAYAQFFHKYPRYKTALNYPNDPYKFIEEIRKAGYATDPNYVSKLHGMLNTYFA